MVYWSVCVIGKNYRTKEKEIKKYIFGYPFGGNGAGWEMTPFRCNSLTQN